MNSSLTKTYTAAGTITEFAAVKLDAANKVVVTGNSANPSCVGIAQTSAVSGDEVNVVVFGRTQMAGRLKGSSIILLLVVLVV